ncbi:hypothetical protein D3C72_785240 [compost metagenome]
MALVLRVVKIHFSERFIPAAIDQNLGSVLVITGRQRAGHAVRIGRVDHAKTKAVAFRLMLFGIAVEVFPQHRREDKFGVHHRLQQFGHGRTMRRIARRNIAQRKVAFQVQVAAKAHQHNALAVLRQEVLAVDNLGIVGTHILCIRHVIAQLVQGLHNNAEGFSAVVAFQVLDVFQHKNRRTTGVDNPHDIKKQRALRIAGKSVCPPKGILFRHASQRERLAREAGQQHIMLRNILSDMLRRLCIADARFVA